MKTCRHAHISGMFLLIFLALGCGMGGQVAAIPTEVAMPAAVTAAPAEISAVLSETPLPSAAPAEDPAPNPPSPAGNTEAPAAQPVETEAPAVPPEAGVATAGDTRLRLTHDGIERSVLLHVPLSYDPAEPSALVLVYHGISLDAEEMVRITGFSALAEEVGFIAAYPNGTGSRQSWNGGTCCGEAAKDEVDDVGFTAALIEYLAGRINLDRKRIYATGFSNGAIMAYRLACDMADQIAAIGPVGAAPAVRSCQPARAISVIHFHGDQDKMNPYEGGTTSAGLKFMPVENGIAAWVKMNGCPAQPRETTNASIVQRVYSPCEAETSVELYKILGGEHAWPGGEAVSAEVGEPTDEISASRLIWDFFSAHPLP